MEQISAAATEYAPKPGRNKLTVALYLPPDLVERIDRIARRDGLSRSWIFEKIVSGWIADQRDGF